MNPSTLPKNARPRRGKTRGAYVANWIETHCVFASGAWVGKPFKLLKWQRDMLNALFELDPNTNLRKKRWAYIQLGKKQGKTELAAALALYFLLGDNEPAPLVVCAAATDEQADLVFGAAKLMAELSPTLSKVTARYDREILVPSLPGAKLQRVAAASGGSLDGKNISAAFIDELHEWRGKRGEQIWNVITNGTGARTQPLIFQITTAGHDQESICYRQYEQAKAVIENPDSDPAYYGLIAEPDDPQCDLLDDKALSQANPSYGVTVQRAFYEDQAKRKTEATFRRYFLNQWVEASEIWEVAQLWDGLSRPGLELRCDLPVCIGVDLARRLDATAVVTAQAQPHPDKPGEQIIVVRAKVWENPYPQGDARRSEWKAPHNEVADHIIAESERFPMPAREVDDVMHPGPAVFMDPWNSALVRDRLETAGVLCVDYPQYDSRMIPASQALFTLAKTGDLAHDGPRKAMGPDPGFVGTPGGEALRRHIRNVTAEEKGRGWRIGRPKGSRKAIDAATAAAIAVVEAQRPIVTPPPSGGVNLW